MRPDVKKFEPGFYLHLSNRAGRPRPAAICQALYKELSMGALPSRHAHLFTVVRDVYGFIFTWRADLLRLTWPFIVLEFIYLWARFFAAGGPDHSASTAVSVFYTFLATVTLVPFAARIQRFALDPKPVDGWLDKNPRSAVWVFMGSFLQFIVPVVAIFLIAAFAMMVISDPTTLGLTPANFIIGFVMAISLGVVITRFIFVFPLSFEKERGRMGQSWRMSSGQHVFLFLLFGFSTVPFRLIYKLSEYLGQYVWASEQIAVTEKLSLYFFAVFLPSTMAIIAQLLITIVTVTIVYQKYKTSEPALIP